MNTKKYTDEELKIRRAEQSRRSYHKHKEKNAAKRNSPEIREKRRQYYKKYMADPENRKKRNEYMAARYAENRDELLEKQKEYQRNNPDVVNAYKAKRKANELQRTPSWLTEDQYAEIDRFYKEAKRLEEETGVKHHVDHIVPIKGSNVSGLHVPWNLQVITAEENQRKGNKYEQ